MTVTTNERGQQNLFAKEPQMYISRTDADRYGYETYAEKAEKLNGRTAMLGFIAAVISYATTGSVFFFGAFGFWIIYTLDYLTNMPDPNALYVDMQKLDDMYKELLWHPDDELQFTHDGQKIIIINKTLENKPWTKRQNVLMDLQLWLALLPP